MLGTGDPRAVRCFTITAPNVHSGDLSERPLSPISDIQRIETIAAVFLGWLAAKPRSISSAGSEGLRDKTAVIDATAAAFDVYPVLTEP